MTTENRQNRAVQKAIKVKELADNTKWTRARVALEFQNAVNLILHMRGNDPAFKLLNQNWSQNLSVPFDWFYNLLGRFDPKGNPITTDPNKIAKKVEFVLGIWLDLVDSVKDRTIILLSAAGISHNVIGRIYTINRQTVSRRHTKALDMLAYRLNHEKYIKSHCEHDRFAELLSQIGDNQ